MKEPIAKAPSGRPERAPVGSRNRLKVHNPDPNYVYRWVNDSDGTGDRIDEFKAAGYEVVPKGTHKLDPRVQQGTEPGSAENMAVGGGIKAVLMRQRKDWYDEDQAKKQRNVDTQEQAIRNPTVDGKYGKIEVT